MNNTVRRLVGSDVTNRIYLDRLSVIVECLGSDEFSGLPDPVLVAGLFVVPFEFIVKRAACALGIRDHSFRGNPVEKTFTLWPAVRAGEDKWIFPFQPLANREYNSALGYEISVLRPLVEPLIRSLPDTHPGHKRARELLEFLGYFEPINKSLVPEDSILQEFIESPR